MNYGIVLRIACIVLALRYVLAAGASLRAKSFVGGVALASFWFPGTWAIATILVQLAVCLFVLFCLKTFPGRS